jgi:Lon protease-like protein
MPEGTTASTAFTCLRNASLTAHTLHPKPTGLLPSFPSFALPSLPLLPGERSQFHFFEPRYRRMCDIALGRADAPPVLPWLPSGAKKATGAANSPITTAAKKPQWSGPDMRYVHIHEPRGLGREVASGVLCTIMDHKTLPDGRFVVTCLAGPRVQVLHSFAEELAEGEPLTHVNVALLRDSNESSEVNTASDEQMALWRGECVMLLEQLGQHTGCLSGRALPSANDSEALAFYVLALLAGGTDHAVHLRRQVLSDMNTQPRLEFALAMLREATTTFIRDANSRSAPQASAAPAEETEAPAGVAAAAELTKEG